MKAGWIKPPCRIMDPSKRGAAAVFVVTKLDRTLDNTMLHGFYAMSGERGDLWFENYSDLRVLS